MSLTPKQEAFALEYILNGKNAAEAYRKVYDTKTTNEYTVYINAHKVKTNTKVALKIHELEMAEFEGAILSIEERKKILSKQGKEGNYKAIDLLNKMESVYTEKIDITANAKVQYYAPTKDEGN